MNNNQVCMQIYAQVRDIVELNIYYEIYNKLYNRVPDEFNNRSKNKVFDDY